MPKLPVIVLALLASGCTSYGVVQNEPLPPGDKDPRAYSLVAGNDSPRDQDISLMVAFSGGGTRAAALAYGVLQELRDTRITIEGREKRLLDEVDVISSVSGGSFTSAYFGLYGDRIFDDYEAVFLRKDVQGALIRGLLNPALWFSSTGRTEMAVQFYEKNVFGDATFGDLEQRREAPLILINASDLGYGVRFSFVQEYFNLLCSDISTFPVARAVTASSAVPVLFNPVVLQNYPDCKDGERPEWLVAAEARAQGNPDIRQVVSGLGTYFDAERRKYAHFVDGGITDNLGLRALYEVIEVAGGIKAFQGKYNRKPPSHAVLISVNASTDPEPDMDLSNKQPSLVETASAMSDVQLHRYNAATLELMESSLRRWAKQLSTQSRTVTAHFVQVDFRNIENAEQRRYFNRIPTSFNLAEEEVDRLILAGRELLRTNPEFQRFLSDLEGPR